MVFRRLNNLNESWAKESKKFRKMKLNNHMEHKLSYNDNRSLIYLKTNSK